MSQDPKTSVPKREMPLGEPMTDPQEIKARAMKDPEFLRAVHGQGFSGVLLRSQYEHATGSKLFSETAQDFEMDVLARMEARDPLEKLLIDQMLWTQVRIGRLSILACQQSGLKQVQVVHGDGSGPKCLPPADAGAAGIPYAAARTLLYGD